MAQLGESLKAVHKRASHAVEYTHLSNLLNGTGGRRWSRSQLQAVCSAIGMTELEVLGPALFGDKATAVVDLRLPPGLSEFVAQHGDDITVDELATLRRLAPPEGEFGEDVWRAMLEDQRKKRARRPR